MQRIKIIGCLMIVIMIWHCNTNFSCANGSITSFQSQDLTFQFIRDTGELIITGSGDYYDTSEVNHQENNKKLFMESEYYNFLNTYDACMNVKKVTINVNNITSTYHMFEGLVHVEEMDFSNFSTEQVKNMSGMFLNCGSVNMTSLDLGDNFDTSNTIYMSEMFMDCGYEQLQEINLGKLFDTSKVETMDAMFLRCGFNHLKVLDLGNKFATNCVNNMTNIFSNCGYESLTKIRQIGRAHV